MKAVTIRVHGRVQGVWFRGSTRTEAQRLGLAGWVRNLADGTVEAHAQGDPRAVDALVAWCSAGPARAEVARLDVEDVAPDDTLADFRIR